MATTLTGFAKTNIEPRLYYLWGGFLNVKHLSFFEPWRWDGGTISLGERAPRASAGSSLLSFGVGGQSSPRIYFVELDSYDVVELANYDNKWHYQDLTSSITAPSAASNSHLSGFAMAGDQPCVFYLDSSGNVQLLTYSSTTTPSWTNTNATQAANAPAAAAGSPLVSFGVFSESSPRVYFLASGSYDVIELSYYNNQWVSQDLTSSTIAPSAASNSPLAGYAVEGNLPSIFYLDSSGNVQQLAFSTSTSPAWTNMNLTTSTNPSAPAAASGSPLVAFGITGPAAGPRIYYLDGDNHIIEIGWMASIGWGQEDLTEFAPAAPAKSGSPLAGFGVGPDLDPRVYYIGPDDVFRELAWSSTTIAWTNPDISNQVDLGPKWMTWLGDKIANRSLSNLSLPGSHDAGMYPYADDWQDSFCTTFANACNSQTQGFTIRDQLNFGMRYFDLRPTIWDSRTHRNRGIYMGHFSNTKVGRRVGCLGPSLEKVLYDVTEFLLGERGANEFMILAFSHTMDVDTGDKFSDSDWAALIADVKHYFRSYLLAGTQYADLMNVTPKDISGAKANVIAIFDEIPSAKIDPANGIFSYRAPSDLNKISPKDKNVIIFDKFSDVQDLAVMETRQDQYFADFSKTATNHQNALCLYSWTLTKPALSGHCNEVAAKTAREHVWDHVQHQITAKQFTSTQLPNIFYADFVDADEPLGVCLTLNLLPSSAAAPLEGDIERPAEIKSL